MKQYLELIKRIKNDGVRKESGRQNMPDTIGISNGLISMNMADGFPLLTTKKMYWKGIVHELLWFLRGETNIKYLVDNNVNIWNDDAYKWYCKNFVESNKNPTTGQMSKDDFTNIIKHNQSDYILNKEWFEGSHYHLGDLGKVYGYQWRNQNGVDQVAEVIKGLKENPYSRYHIIDGWNKADFKDMALPPCHLLYQFIVRPLTVHERKMLLSELPEWKGQEMLIYEDPSGDIVDVMNESNIPKFYLDLNLYQRSADSMLGVPFNIASMSLLLHIFAKASGMVAGVANWIGGDTHLYVNHLFEKNNDGVIPVEEQLSRYPKELPKLKITKDINSLEDILNLTIDDFIVEGYDPYPSIKAELFVGLKK